MGVTVVLTGIPNYVTLTDLARTLDQFLDTEEVGTFRVRELPPYKNFKRRVGLDFKSGFDAIAAQTLLDNYSYQIEGGEQYILRARMTSQGQLVSSRSPSPLAVARRAGTRSPPGQESDDSVGRRNASLVTKISDAELDRLNAKLNVHLEDLKRQQLLIKKEKKWRTIAKKHKRRTRSSDSDRSRTSRTRDRSRSRSRPRSRSKSRSKKKRCRRSSAKGRRGRRSKDRRSRSGSRRMSRSRSRDRPRAPSMKPRTPPGTPPPAPPPRPSHSHKRKMSSRARTPPSLRMKSRSAARDAEVIAVQRKKKIAAPSYDGPSTSKHEGGRVLQEAMETEFEARREGAILKILMEMETLLQNLDSKSGGKMTPTDKQMILQHLEQVINERVACLRANRHLTIPQLVTYYRCEYARADDADLVQKLMTEVMGMKEARQDKDGGNVEDGSRVVKPSQDSEDKPKPQTPTETPKSSADESDSSQNINVSIKIVPKREDLELKINFGHDDIIKQNIINIIKPETSKSKENKTARKKRAKKKKAKNKLSILYFQPGAKVKDPHPPMVVFHGPKTISPNPKFILPVKNLIREMKAEIKHKTNDDLFIFVLKRNLRYKIRDLLKGKNYVASKEIKSIYRKRYPKENDKELVEELERDILAGKYNEVADSGDEKEVSPHDGNEQKSKDHIEDVVIQTPQKQAIAISDTEGHTSKENIDDVVTQAPQTQAIAISDSEEEGQAVGVTNTASLSNKNPNCDKMVYAKSTNHILTNIVSSECSNLLLLVCNKPEDFQQEYIKIAKKIVEKRVHSLVTLYSHLKFTEALKYYKTLFPKDSNKRLSDLITKNINNDVIDETEDCDTTDGENGTKDSVKTTNESATTEENSEILPEIDEGTSNIEQETKTQAKVCNEKKI